MVKALNFLQVSIMNCKKPLLKNLHRDLHPILNVYTLVDTIEKDLVKNVEKLKELGFEITLHDKMPDVVLYREDKDWIYFVESVTSVGPMDPKRILEIEEMDKRCYGWKDICNSISGF